MSKKVLLIAGVLLAAGSVAAISSPYFRDGQLRLGQLFAGFGDDDGDARSHRSRKRHRELDADGDGPAVRRSARHFEAAGDEGGGERNGLTGSRRERSAMRDADDGDGALDLRGRVGRWFGSRARGRHDSEDADTGKSAGRPGRDADRGSRRASAERQPGRSDGRFSRLDRNGDGVIDAKDFEARAVELAANATRRFLERFDTDGDGKVSREEFEQAVKDGPKERVADLELDGDDRIGDAERPLKQPRRGIVK